MHVLGTEDSVLMKEVSSFQRQSCAGLNLHAVETKDSVPNERDVLVL